MVQGTVGLPIFNSKRIAWLCLESLCHQHKPTEGFELIVFEESQPNQLGEAYIRSYEERLAAVGCEKITYLTSKIKVSLPYKWQQIGKAADNLSKYYCLCAADNYYHPWMLQDSERAIRSCDWFITTRGYFYDFGLKTLVRYTSGANVGLQMTAATKLTRNMPSSTLPRGIDGWFFKNLCTSKILKCQTDHWEHTLCTNGLNNISKGRHRFFSPVRKPFYTTDKKLEMIVPDDIADRLKQIKI